MTKSLQARVEEIATQIGELGADEKAQVFAMSWWSEHTLEWAMSNPEFKTQLFRFVDVFPATHGVNDVVKHMGEYFSGATVPRFVNLGVELADNSLVGRPIAAGIAKTNIEKMAHQFIAGEDVRSAESNLRALWDAGSGCILDLLGEKTVTEQEAHSYQLRVLKMIDDLAEVSKSWPKNEKLSCDDLGETPAVQVSVKLSALSAHYSPLTREKAVSEIVERLQEIYRRAIAGNIFVWLDMEYYDGKDITLESFEKAIDSPEFDALHTGVVIQAYLKDSFKDLQSMVKLSEKRKTPIGLRLVKGAQWDAEVVIARANDWPTPVWSKKIQSDANYERCTRYLHDNHGTIRAAFASHNIRSLAYAIAYAKEKNIPDNGYEIQMLYGMAEPMHAGVRELGIRHRVYSPIGALLPGMAYLVRRLLENTSNESFVRMRFAEDRSLGELVVEPIADLQEDRDLPSRRTASNANKISAYNPEPLREWRDGSVRTSFGNAVEKFATAKAESVPAFIEDNEVYTQNTIDSVDPTFPDKVVAQSASCTASHIDGAIESAKKAYAHWSDASASYRAGVLFAAAEWMRARRDEISAIEVLEAGKPWIEADADVCEAIDFFEYYARQAIRIENGSAIQSPPGETNTLHYQSRGLVAVISPWNFPLAIPTGQVVGALAAGNCVLFKPAEQTPLIALQMFRALQAGGLPPGVLSFLPGVGEEIGSYLVTHPDISVIAFTGSMAVGLGINEAASKHVAGMSQVKRVIAEMGGKNPLIVDSDADIDQVVPIVLQSAFGFSGQKCSALSRLIIHKDSFDDVVERLRGAVAALFVGNPREMGTQVGPVIDSEAFVRLMKVRDNLAQQGEIVVSHPNIPSTGYFVPPTVVIPKNSQVEVARNELFGPILSVFKAKSFENAIEIANDTEYALTAGCLSRSPENISRAIKSLRGGNVYINRGITGAIVGRHPFGGYGMSGVGSKAGGPDYLQQFMDPRAVSENTMRQGFAPELFGDEEVPPTAL